MIFKIWNKVLYIAYVAIVTGVILFINHRFWIQDLREKSPYLSITLKKPKDVSNDLFNDLGYLSIKNDSHFDNFKTEKNKNTTRIGFFGDSYIWGAEVGESSDIPTQVQKILSRQSPKKFEVLNFANNWHGTHQAFRLWQKLAKEYEIDIVAMGIGCFCENRELTFAHAFPIAPSYLHGRYIIEEAKLKFLPVKGDYSQKSRFEKYYGFFTPLQYIFYDRALPAFLKHLDWSNSRSIKNPFYYLNTHPTEEATKIYSLIFEEMSKNSQKVIFLHSRKELIDSISYKAENFLSSHIPDIEKFNDFPYQMRGHYSGTANYQLAKLFSDAITNKTVANLAVMKLKPSLPLSSQVNAVNPQQKKISSIDLFHRKVRMATLTEDIPHQPKSITKFENRYKRLIFVKSKNQSFSNSLLVGTNQPVQHQQPVFLGDKSIGLLRKTIPETNIYTLEIPNLQREANSGMTPDFFYTIDINKAGGILKYSSVEALRNGSFLTVGKKPLLKLTFQPQENKLQLRPVENSFLFFLPDKDYIMTKINEEDSIEAKITFANSSIQKHPLDSIRREQYDFPIKNSE